MKENMMKSSKLINFLKNLKTENKSHLYHLEFRIRNKFKFITKNDLNTATTTSKAGYQKGITT